jgi:hypothetical protein
VQDCSEKDFKCKLFGILIQGSSTQSRVIDPFEESKRIIEAAENQGVKLRLIGGLAVRFHCHGPHSMHLRAYQDIDLFGLSTQYKEILLLFQKMGYSPNARYNALYGETRLQFIGPKGGKNVDVFLDRFTMQHKLDFRRRLELDPVTVPITDLLMTKLQNVKLTEKDAKDIVAILEDHEVGSTDEGETINVHYIADLCSRDWGLYKTVSDNLSSMVKVVENGQMSALDKERSARKLEAILEAIQTAKKRLKWKLRRIIGQKVKWYNEVELGEGEL